jgi:predicted permease
MLYQLINFLLYHFFFGMGAVASVFILVVLLSGLFWTLSSFVKWFWKNRLGSGGRLLFAFICVGISWLGLKQGEGIINDDFLGAVGFFYLIGVIAGALFFTWTILFWMKRDKKRAKRFLEPEARNHGHIS